MQMQLANVFAGFAGLLWVTLADDVVRPLITGEFAEAMDSICSMQDAQRTEEVPVQGMPENTDCGTLKSDAYQRAYLHGGLVILGTLAWGFSFASSKNRWLFLLLSSLAYGAIWTIKFLSISDFGQFLAVSLSGQGSKLVAVVWREVVAPTYFAALIALSASLAYRASGKPRADR